MKRLVDNNTADIRRKPARQGLGRTGERLAAEELARLGYRILERNFRCSQGEIDLVESAKNVVSAAVSRTSWEAQKQMRVRGKQGEVDKLLDQRRHLLDEVGQVVMNLYLKGALSDPQLSRLCASIMELDHDVKNREGQLEEINNES